MSNDETRNLINLIIAEFEELAAILAQIRDQHPLEARRRIDERFAACNPAPIIQDNPVILPPFPDCDGFRSLSAVAVLRAVEQLHGAQALVIRRLCELYEQASGPAPS